MSAIGPKQTCASALHMSAFGGKADMALCGSPLLRSLSGVKRTCCVALHMSAFDPKRTLLSPLLVCWFRAVRCLGHGMTLGRSRLDEKTSAYCERARRSCGLGIFIDTDGRVRRRQSDRRHVEIEIICSRDSGDERALQPAW